MHFYDDVPTPSSLSNLVGTQPWRHRPHGSAVCGTCSGAPLFWPPSCYPAWRTGRRFRRTPRRAGGSRTGCSRLHICGRANAHITPIARTRLEAEQERAADRELMGVAECVFARPAPGSWDKGRTPGKAALRLGDVAWTRAPPATRSGGTPTPGPLDRRPGWHAQVPSVSHWLRMD